MTRLLLAVLALLSACAAEAAPRPPHCPDGNDPFPDFYTERALFDDAEKKAAALEPLAEAPSGLTVPHHMLAADIIARGFRLADGHKYKRVIILFPDHFRVSGAMFATTGRSFATLNGMVPGDDAAAKTLLAASALVEENCLFSSDHGLQAMLPFVARHFPGVPVLPVAVNIRADAGSLSKMADLLAPFAGEATLVLQSTDFSHYLPQHEARQRDQQTLNILAASDFGALAGLIQPDHVDSLGALTLQMLLQDAVHGARPVVFANENSQQYSDRFTDETTSYIGMVFSRALAGKPAPDFPGAEIAYVAGDVFFGRAMSEVLSDPDAADAVAASVLSLTKGRPLIINLEGVVLPNVPAGLDGMTLAMPESLAAGILKRIHAAAASLANNHANDLGESGRAETLAALNSAGIAAIGQGGKFALGPVDFVALSDLETYAARQTDLLTPALLDALIQPDAARPVIALVHWGREYVMEAGEREKFLAGEMRDRGVAAIIGAHPHVASKGLQALSGGQTVLAQTLGNFIFDQTAERASGALAEITAFRQGTVFVRLIPVPNHFDMARQIARP